MLRHVTSAALAATFVLGGASVAAADAGAQGGAAKSPGVLSGNVVQVPIDIPIQVCGNTVDILALLNPAAGNKCIAK
ncbi:chaplin [Streptomyces oryzae]|uniref:Chaplin n=1 Tax=Streptomyces oryzae TaxID=1434886 RepID=A0ABS3XML9_9ACTN|nr:chaplin [Streptomyces oryzae]MBO8196554.1 chaplin [Streptomyces oryzae]